MFPILTPQLPASASASAPSGEGLVGGATLPGADTGDGAGPEVGPAERGPESKSFSAVLLALASIGTPLHAAPAPPSVLPSESARAAFFETAHAIDHEALASAVERDAAWEGGALLATLEGAHGIAREEMKDGSEGDRWMAFKVIEGEVVYGGAVDIGALEGIGAIRPMESDALAELLSASIDAELAPADAKVEALAETFPEMVEVAPIQVAPQVGPPTDVQEVVEGPGLDPRMLNRLSREFVARLERVSDRMFTEFGMEMQVVEGYRSQSRQDALFAQGRTAPGNVVTWTTNSLHTSGAAADVFVDGSPVTAEQAAILARVAAEEGLRTLYPYDSGHIQLDGIGRSGTPGPEGPLEREPAAGRAGAGSSLPPGVARPAPVARVARPARPGGPGGMVLNSLPGNPAPGAGPATDTEALTAAKQALESAPGAAAAKGERTAMVPAEASTGAAAEARPVSSDAGAAGGVEGKPVSQPAQTSAPLVDASIPDAIASKGGARASPTTSPLPVDLSAFDVMSGSEYRRLHLPIEGVAGSASLDIGVRPGSVDALLNVSDPQLADELRRSLHELRQVLVDRGIEARGLGVRLVADAAGETVQTTLEGAARSSSNDGASGQSTTHGERERGARYRDTAEEQDLPRRQEREPSNKENDRWTP